MQLAIDDQVKNYVSRFDSLSENDKLFLKTLASFGGACSRKDASIALGFPQIHQVNSLLDRLNRQRFLTRKICAGVEGYPVIYFVSSKIAHHLKVGWFRFDSMKGVLRRAFRFSVATKNRQRKLWSYRNGLSQSPVSSQTYQYLHKNMIDAPICLDTKTILLDCLPYDSFQNLTHKLKTLMRLEPDLKIELWSPCQVHLEKLSQSLPEPIKQSITAMVHHHEPIYAGYAKAIEDARYSQFNFDDTEGVFA